MTTATPLPPDGKHTIAVLPLTELDWPEVSTVCTDGIATVHATFETEPPTTWGTFDTSEHPDHRLAARDEGDTLLGWVAVSPVSSRPVHAGVVGRSLHIVSGARGRGVGRRLPDELISSTADSGIRTIPASLCTEDHAGVALNRAARFREFGRRERIARTTHGPPAGQWRDTVSVERRRPVPSTAASSARRHLRRSASRTRHSQEIMMPRPHILFVCVKNGGKSQMAAGLMRQAAGDAVTVDSAGTEAGDELNAQSVESLAEAGVDIGAERPKQLTDDLVRAADLVVVLGGEAKVEPLDGTPVEVWETDEPSRRGIEGMERMRLVRDDIARRVEQLTKRLTTVSAGSEG